MHILSRLHERNSEFEAVTLLFVFVRLGLLFRQVKAQGYCKTIVILSGIEGTLTYPLTNCSWLRMNHQSYDA